MGSWIDAVDPGWLTEVLRGAGVTQAAVVEVPGSHAIYVSQPIGC